MEPQPFEKISGFLQHFCCAAFVYLGVLPNQINCRDWSVAAQTKLGNLNILRVIAKIPDAICRTKDREINRSVTVVIAWLRNVAANSPMNHGRAITDQRRQITISVRRAKDCEIGDSVAVIICCHRNIGRQSPFFNSEKRFFKSDDDIPSSARRSINRVITSPVCVVIARDGNILAEPPLIDN